MGHAVEKTAQSSENSSVPSAFEGACEELFTAEVAPLMTAKWNVPLLSVGDLSHPQTGAL